MTPDVSDFILGSLEDSYKHIEVANGHKVTEKQKGQVRIKMCDDYEDLFIATLHNVLLAPYLCDRLFSIITLMNSRYNCLFHKWFCTVYFGANEKMQLHYHIVHKGNMIFWGKSRKRQRQRNYHLERKFSRIIASKIRSQIHKIIVGCGY